MMYQSKILRKLLPVLAMIAMLATIPAGAQVVVVEEDWEAGATPALDWTWISFDEDVPGDTTFAVEASRMGTGGTQSQGFVDLNNPGNIVGGMRGGLVDYDVDGIAKGRISIDLYIDSMVAGTQFHFHLARNVFVEYDNFADSLANGDGILHSKFINFGIWNNLFRIRNVDNTVAAVPTTEAPAIETVYRLVLDWDIDAKSVQFTSILKDPHVGGGTEILSTVPTILDPLFSGSALDGVTGAKSFGLNTQQTSTFQIDNLVISDMTEPEAITPSIRGFVEEGNTLTLTAPTGSSYQWKRNGVDLGGETNAQLVFDPVLTSDAGVYVVEYDDGSKAIVESAPYTLTVYPAASLPVGNFALLTIVLLTILVAGKRLQAARSE